MNELSGAMYVGVVDSSKLDDDGCLRVRIPALNGIFDCRVAMPLAGAQRGVFFLPERLDQVLLGCVTGSDVEFVLLGSLLSGKTAAPELEGADDNDTKLIRTRGGNEIRLFDHDGTERIEIATKKQCISLSVKDDTVVVTAGKIKLEGDVDVTGTLKIGKGDTTTTIKDNQITGAGG
ncbi:phage baseplate assembly protein V [Herbaspirillum rhizosphaerae]|uniref:phage baseplate assembly protein V n=1 Tax=Herbaspirillum rhizosphaerae TaxID=346179 RepID=UPI000B280816|nr:phage baseplate assembly protein V [Herbaspirillum rhizosphaerae]